MPHLFGPRIRLRAAEKGDIPDFLRWINDPEVTENLLLVYPMSHVEEENWFENMMKSDPVSHVMVIDIPTENNAHPWRAIGTCQLHNVNWRVGSAEIGIMIGEKSFWNQGYGTETMKRLLKHGFESLNFHRMWLRVYERNARGIRAYEKAGFKHEGTFREAEYANGAYFNVDIMSVLRHEWQQD